MGIGKTKGERKKGNKEGKGEEKENVCRRQKKLLNCDEKDEKE